MNLFVKINYFIIFLVISFPKKSIYISKTKIANRNVFDWPEKNAAIFVGSQVVRFHATATAIEPMRSV